MRISELFVMIVEPSKTQRRIIEEQLRKAGIVTIVAAANGEEALAAIAADQPDLVVSALYLPDMSGADLLFSLREADYSREIAFVLISSETRFRYLDPVKQAGATAVLPKPFSEEQLLTALNTTLHNIEPEEGALEEAFDLELMRVLLVDDSPMARKFIRKVLEGMGFCHFAEASDGAEALSKLSGEVFDLVVTDYNMPNIDGQELTHQIRTNSTQQSVPVLMVTSEANEGRLSGIHQSGVSALCDKPFSAGEVKALLRRLLSDNQQADAC